MRRVLTCDDHEIGLETLRAQVEAQDDLEVVGEAGDCEAAVAA